VSSSKKTCVIYANCQGEAVSTFLKKSKSFVDTYEIVSLVNYVVLAEKTVLDKNILANADLFIYQPLADRHGVYSTKEVLKLLSPTCKKLSFAYIYNDGLWPLLIEDKVIKGEDIILKLLQEGLSLPKIILRFYRGKIDFRLKERFKKSLNILSEKEKSTDIKTTEYILENIESRRLFLTQNHHTSEIYIYITNQILDKLKFNPIPGPNTYTFNEANLPDCWPQSPYETYILNYKYITDWKTFHGTRRKSNWLRFNIKIISQIYNRYYSSLWRRIYCFSVIRMWLIACDYMNLGVMKKV
jgi:hypothetical protein